MIEIKMTEMKIKEGKKELVFKGSHCEATTMFTGCFFIHIKIQ